ncbi:MAG: hypothetical protein KF809_08515 [Chloroflexi bacterium]|nr:hypothetical protein [Chloroflexota bacterium]
MASLIDRLLGRRPRGEMPYEGPPPAVFVKVFQAGSAEEAGRLAADHATRMARAGYVPLSSSWADGPTSAIAVLLLNWVGFLFRDRGRLTVTYTYRPDVTGPPTARLKASSVRGA